MSPGDRDGLVPSPEVRGPAQAGVAVAALDGGGGHEQADREVDRVAGVVEVALVDRAHEGVRRLLPLRAGGPVAQRREHRRQERGLAQLAVDHDLGLAGQVRPADVGIGDQRGFAQVIRHRISPAQRAQPRADRVEHRDVVDRRPGGAEAASQLERDDPAEGPADQVVRRAGVGGEQLGEVVVDPAVHPARGLIGRRRWERDHATAAESFFQSLDVGGFRPRLHHDDRRVHRLPRCSGPVGP